jgi:hypothetical protein
MVTGSSLSTTPQVTLALDLKLTGQGTITSNSPYVFYEVVSPGSYQNNIASAYLPEYTNGYGIFNLLKTPTITRTYAYYDEYDPNDYYMTVPVFTRGTSKFKLDNIIKYIVNPNAGFDLQNSDVKASLVFNGNFGDGVSASDSRTLETEIYPIGCLTDLEVPFDETRDYYSTPTMFNGWTPGEVIVKIYARLRVADTNKDVFYVNSFATKINYVYDYNYSNASFDPVYPSTNCTYVNPPATDVEIKAVCNTQKYKDKVQEFYLRTESNKPHNFETSISANVTIKQNPVVNQKLSFAIKDVLSNSYSIEFYDVSGRLIHKSQKQVVGQGITEVGIDLKNAKSHGLGLLKIDDGKSIKTFKIVY